MQTVCCNKCGEYHELVLEGVVCKGCSEGLDQRWATVTATDWVLISTTLPAKLLALLASLEGSRVSAERRLGFYIFRNTSYAEMKSRWAICEVPDRLTFCNSPTVEDIEAIRALAANYGSGNVSFFRLATSEEIARHNEYQREEQRHQIISQVFEKWGFDDEGHPLDRLDHHREPMEGFDNPGRKLNGHEYPEAEYRMEQASIEIERTLQERGLAYLNEIE